MKISRETRESLIFMVGLFGLVSQGFVMPVLGKSPSIPLCLVFLFMLGLIGGPALLAALVPSADSPRERRRGNGDGESNE